jgi:ubiquitin-conjugating enzyme E2 R
MSGEHISERWRPTHTPSSVLLSVISMLSDPNTSSPANVDASVEWRDRRKQFEERVRKLAEKAQKLCPEGIKIPHPDTDPEERERAIRKIKLLNEEDNWMDDGMDDIEDEDDFDDDDGSEADFLEEESEVMDEDVEEAVASDEEN